MKDSQPWQQIWAEKIVPIEKALSRIRSGQTIFIGSGSGEPLLLTEALYNMAPKFWDLQVIHLIAQKESKLARPEVANRFRYNTYYIGRSVAEAVAEGTADYTPMSISELPSAMSRGIISVDVALISISPPFASGFCSLGISVDTVKAAVEHAALVIAQVNENMPVTMGDSLIPVDSIHYLVEGAPTPLIEVPTPGLDPISLTIGRHISKLIGDGMCLHFDHSMISVATQRYLDTKKDLGIHTDILTDDILRLIRSGVVTNKKKNIKNGKTVATMVMGTAELYNDVDRNPNIEIYPIDWVNDPFVIAQNNNMVSILSIDKIELSGLGWADIDESTHLRSLPSSMDFIDGSVRSKNGFTVMALPSTSPDGKQSNIVAGTVGRGVSFSRSKVDFVTTEYGTVYLRGLSYRERAIALISIAHPKFRRELMAEAKRVGYVGKDQVIIDCPESGMVYPHHYECTRTFKGGLQVFFRPVKPSDARLLQKMFYSLSPDMVRLRYHATIKKLSNGMAQLMANIDYSRDMAIVGVVGPPGNREIIAEGRYSLDPNGNMGEFDMVVREDYQKRGIGTFLANYLNKIAYTSGLAGVYAEVIPHNAATMALLTKAWPTAKKHFESGTCTFTVRFPREDVDRPKNSIFIYSGRFGDYSYGEDHPFRTDRAKQTLRLINQQGYLDEPWMRVEEPRMINPEQLGESHDPAFIKALEEANSGKFEEEFITFNIGSQDCPIFPGLFDWALLYTSATLTGVHLIINENANVVFNPVGGFHHASRAHAEGFCYVNDVIVAIDAFLAHGYRVAYIDIDAHHANGVQDAYYQDDRVLVISLHESGKTLYPWSGFKEEIGADMGKGFTINIPLPQQTDDEAFEWVFDKIVCQAIPLFRPTVVVAVVGADTHKNDPLSNLNLTNEGMANVVTKIREFSHHLLLLGGGGYDLQSTSRAWCRMWAAANRVDAMPDYLLVLGGRFMGSEELKGAEIMDMRFQISGKQKDDIMAELKRIVAYHETHTLPIIRSRNSAAQESA